MNRPSPVLDELLLLISDIETEIDMRVTRTAMLERHRRVLRAARCGSIQTTPVSAEAREAYEAREAARRRASLATQVANSQIPKNDLSLTSSAVLFCSTSIFVRTFRAETRSSSASCRSARTSLNRSATPGVLAMIS